MSDAAHNRTQPPRVVRLPADGATRQPAQAARDLAGEDSLARELAKLGDTWTVLPGVDPGPGEHIDPVVIGSGGVFTLAAHWLPYGAQVTVTPRRVVVDGQGRAYYAAAVQSASRAADRLREAVGATIPVAPLVVLTGVDIAGVRIVQQPAEVKVLLGQDLCRWLEWQRPRLDVGSAARLARAARRSATWSSAERVVVLDAAAPPGGQPAGGARRAQVARNRP